MPIRHSAEIDAHIEAALRDARIPGAAIAAVIDGEVAFVGAYGWRDLEARLPMTAQTVYPIASTTKSINATLLGMLVDEGRLAWDTPVQNYLPSFRLRDPAVSAQVTLRDLVTMRTGLARHDWLWNDNELSRVELVARLRYLESSHGLRERFQYNNLSVTAAGYIAEFVTNERWECLVRERILEPIGMAATGFTLPAGNVTLSYLEDRRRQLHRAPQFTKEVTAPSGGVIHSTVEDMARWLSFNLQSGVVDGRQLIEPRTLAEIHSPQVLVGADPSAPSPQSSYAMGWFVDSYNGCTRLSHGGYLRSVNSEMMLFPRERMGLVCFTNFGAARLARLIAQRAFDIHMGFTTAQSVTEKLALYEKNVEDNRKRIDSTPRVPGTSPSHPLQDYAGAYFHPGYGRFTVELRDQALVLKRNRLILPLQHWHFDAWTVADNELFEIHTPHAFDGSNRILFDTDADGAIAAVRLPLEPAVAAIRFEKEGPRTA